MERRVPRLVASANPIRAFGFAISGAAQKLIARLPLVLVIVFREFHEALEAARHPTALCPHPEDLDTLVKNGGAIVGSHHIRDRVRHMAEEAGASYLISQFSFGDPTQEQVMHSVGIFAREMLPAARECVAQAV